MSFFQNREKFQAGRPAFPRQKKRTDQGERPDPQIGEVVGDSLLLMSKEMSSLYFGLNVVHQVEAKALEFDAVYMSKAASVFLMGGCLFNSQNSCFEKSQLS